MNARFSKSVQNKNLDFRALRILNAVFYSL